MDGGPEKIAAPPPPVEKLGREGLSYLIEVCLAPKEILQAFKELGVHAPGYRLDRLPHADLAVMYAEEALAAKDARERAASDVARALGGPSFAGVPFSSAMVKEVLTLLREDPVGEAARLCWRLLEDPDPEVAALATEAAATAIDVLDALAKARGEEDAAPAPVLKPDEALRRADELAARLERALADAERGRDQLKTARLQLAEIERRLGEERRVADAAKEDLAALRTEAARLREAGGDKGLHAEAEARRLSDESRSLSRKLHAAEARAEQAEERSAALEREAEELRQARPAAPAAALDAVESGPDEVPDWVVPHFTREFYDSLKGWDRRQQRSAFEKAMLLARDRRHPSLRAIALEGVEGYYRIRVATDVRLIYRLGERGGVEILSLIDREDLDRYIKQAKTRPG